MTPPNLHSFISKYLSNQQLFIEHLLCVDTALGAEHTTAVNKIDPNSYPRGAYLYSCGRKEVINRVNWHNITYSYFILTEVMRERAWCSTSSKMGTEDLTKKIVLVESRYEELTVRTMWEANSGHREWQELKLSQF